MKKLTIIIFTLFVIKINAQQITVNYTYDNLNRLTSASYSTGAGIQYSYDALGNRTQVTSQSSLAIVETSFANNDVILYPNPFAEELFIKTKNSKVRKVMLFDSSGRLILEEKVNNAKDYTLKPKKLISGTYLLTVFTDQGKQSHKIIKK